MKSLLHSIFSLSSYQTQDFFIKRQSLWWDTKQPYLSLFILSSSSCPPLSLFHLDFHFMPNFLPFPSTPGSTLSSYSSFDFNLFLTRESLHLVIFPRRRLLLAPAVSLLTKVHSNQERQRFVSWRQMRRARDSILSLVYLCSRSSLWCPSFRIICCYRNHERHEHTSTTCFAGAWKGRYTTFGRNRKVLRVNSNWMTLWKREDEKEIRKKETSGGIECRWDGWGNNWGGEEVGIYCFRLLLILTFHVIPYTFILRWGRDKESEM